MLVFLIHYLISVSSGPVLPPGVGEKQLLCGDQESVAALRTQSTAQLCAPVLRLQWRGTRTGLGRPQGCVHRVSLG